MSSFTANEGYIWILNFIPMEKERNVDICQLKYVEF